jgi:hypothetical protein
MPLRCVALWAVVCLGSALVQAGPARANVRVRTVRVDREQEFAASDALLGAAAAAVVVAFVAAAAPMLERRRSTRKRRSQ